VWWWRMALLLPHGQGGADVAPWWYRKGAAFTKSDRNHIICMYCTVYILYMASYKGEIILVQ
jgi:hypothetical protein